MKKVAINGFGRIGRAFLKLAITNPEVMKEIEIVAINDLGDIENMIYLLKHDSVYRQKVFKNIESKIVSEEEKYLVVSLLSSEVKEIRFISEKDTNKFVEGKIWEKLGVDIVVECTGLFISYDKAEFHLDSGAKRVVISAPSKDELGAMHKSETVLMGINEMKLRDCKITSNT